MLLNTYFVFLGHALWKDGWNLFKPLDQVGRSNPRSLPGDVQPRTLLNPSICLHCTRRSVSTILTSEFRNRLEELVNSLVLTRVGTTAHQPLNQQFAAQQAAPQVSRVLGFQDFRVSVVGRAFCGQFGE